VINDAQHQQRPPLFNRTEQLELRVIGVPAHEHVDHFGRTSDYPCCGSGDKASRSDQPRRAVGDRTHLIGRSSKVVPR
jgi:hypothetical protein